METSNKGGPPVKTMQTSFEILEHLMENDGSTLMELTDSLDLAKSTIHRHLATLQEEQFVVKEGLDYYPSLRFLDFAEYARTRKMKSNIAKKKVEELAQETKKRTQLVMEEQGEGVLVYRTLGPHAVRPYPEIGRRFPLHSTAAGKAILAYLPPDRIDEIIDTHGLPAITVHTITDRELLLEELEKVRDRGYSVNDQENIDGLRAVGSPVFGRDETVIGGLSLSCPSHRMRGEEFEKELPEVLLGATNELKLILTHS